MFFYIIVKFKMKSTFSHFCVHSSYNYNLKNLIDAQCMFIIRVSSIIFSFLLYIGAYSDISMYAAQTIFCSSCFRGRPQY